MYNNEIDDDVIFIEEESPEDQSMTWTQFFEQRNTAHINPEQETGD